MRRPRTNRAVEPQKIVRALGKSYIHIKWGNAEFHKVIADTS
jgi:hypothetical protein